MVAHSVDLLSKCAQFRDESEFIDVRLKVGEDVFPAHRIVLAANSDYFHAMFTDGMKESKQEVIELKDESISPNILKIVMDSIYTGDLHVVKENVFEVLAATDHLQVTSVVKLCCDFLLIEFVQLHFDVQTYCRVWTIADRHGLKDLKEAAENKMASMFNEICGSDEFLTHFGGDELFSLLSRDDVSAPSETFVFKSVMQWIKHKKEERMTVAAKVIGAVRLGLVDIKVLVAIDMHERKSDTGPDGKCKVEYETVAQYFDAEAKIWKPLTSMAQLMNKTQSCFCAEYIGNYLYVAAKRQPGQFVIYRYHIANNSWETLPSFLESNHQINCLCAVDDYIYAISVSNPPQRYNLANNNWQKGAKSNFKSDFWNRFCTIAAVVWKSDIYVIHGKRKIEGSRKKSYRAVQPAVVHCFDPAINKWEQKASTCKPHFGSSLFVVNSRLYVAGGKKSCSNDEPYGDSAAVEVYNEENNTWSVVEQKHIPPNNLGAVQIEGRVYFIINKFPIDSGIRIPPGEVYHIHLNEWENLAKVSDKAVLCYLPVKRESFKTEESESQTD